MIDRLTLATLNLSRTQSGTGAHLAQHRAVRHYANGQHERLSQARKSAIDGLRLVNRSLSLAQSDRSAHLVSTGLYNNTLWVTAQAFTLRQRRVAKSVECGGHESVALSQPRGRLREHHAHRRSGSSQEFYPNQTAKSLGKIREMKKNKDITDASYG